MGKKEVGEQGLQLVAKKGTNLHPDKEVKRKEIKRCWQHVCRECSGLVANVENGLSPIRVWPACLLCRQINRHSGKRQEIGRLEVMMEC